MQCFPDSLATKLGLAYVEKTFDWYLVNAGRFLFHIEIDNIVVGYCGGFVPSKPGDGSSSGTLQHAFNQAIKGLVKKPWLLFHAEVKPHYPFLWRNIKRRITGKVKPAIAQTAVSKPFKPYCGLVVIGVLPSHRGQGLVQKLMVEFEDKARGLHQTKCKLSVKKNNLRALNAYKKQGWYIGEEQPVTYVMEKEVE